MKLCLLVIIVFLVGCSNSGKLSLTFIGDMPISVTSEKLELSPIKQSITLNSLDYGHYDIKVLFSDNQEINLKLCHQNNWLTEEISIERKIIEIGKVTINHKNQELDQLLIININDSDVIQLGVCG